MSTASVIAQTEFAKLLDRLPPFVLISAIAAVAAGFVAMHYLGGRRERQGMTRLLERDPSLRRTSEPCGYGASQIVGTDATPRGDRRYGIEHGVSGRSTASIAGVRTEVECAAFRWWYEERQTSRNSNGTSSTSYRKQRVAVAAVRLPAVVPGRLVVRPESVLGRIGLTRGGQQLESSEFNRRFRVVSDDTRLSLHLLTANLQQRLLEEFEGRTIVLASDLLLLAGDPRHRDGSLPGFIGSIPAVRQDLLRLVDAVPPAFWRALGADLREA